MAPPRSSDAASAAACALDASHPSFSCSSARRRASTSRASLPPPPPPSRLRRKAFELLELALQVLGLLRCLLVLPLLRSELGRSRAAASAARELSFEGRSPSAPPVLPSPFAARAARAAAAPPGAARGGLGPPPCRGGRRRSMAPGPPMMATGCGAGFFLGGCVVVSLAVRRGGVWSSLRCLLVAPATTKGG
jgi:hypothetical protein